MAFFDSHEAGCLPLAQCRICSSVSFLRAKMGDDALSRFLEILGDATPDDGKAKKLAVGVEEMGLSVRAINCLRNEGLDTVGDILSKTRADLLRIPNFGRGSLDEVERYLNAQDLRLAHTRIWTS